MSNTPTDAEIVAVMRDGYKCRYNDEQDHIDFARAVLAKCGTPQPENLGFTIENRAGADVVVWKEGGCRPATSAEIAMWKALSAVQQPVVREPLTDAQIAEMMRDTWGCASIAPRHVIEFARTVERAHGITQEGGS